MYGVMVVFYMKYGALDTSHLKNLTLHRLVINLVNIAT